MTEIWGIINVTPDSFSDGGKFMEKDAALKHGRDLCKEGASVLDVGAESTRPGADIVDAETEISRLIPVIKALKEETDLPISADTYKAVTAAAALDAGALVINDISGLADPEMKELIAERKCPYCLTYNEAPDASKKDILYRALDFFERKTEELIAAGVRGEDIIIDPGIGFNKSQEENLKLIKSAGEFKKTGFKLLYGISRKSFVALCCGSDMEEREAGTAALDTYLALLGVDILRVHNVRMNIAAVKMAEVLKGSKING